MFWRPFNPKDIGRYLLAARAGRQKGDRSGPLGAVALGRVLADQNKAEAVGRLAPIADRLRAFKAEGLTLRCIAEALNADGSPPLAGRPGIRGTCNGPWRGARPSWAATPADLQHVCFMAMDNSNS